MKDLGLTQAMLVGHKVRDAKQVVDEDGKISYEAVTRDLQVKDIIGGVKKGNDFVVVTIDGKKLLIKGAKNDKGS